LIASDKENSGRPFDRLSGQLRFVARLNVHHINRRSAEMLEDRRVRWARDLRLFGGDREHDDAGVRPPRQAEKRAQNCALALFVLGPPDNDERPGVAFLLHRPATQRLVRQANQQTRCR
jgi:hypothetical protein